jgi:hypothetical protein
MRVANSPAQNGNVELGERSGLKLFNHGITEYLLNFRRIDGGWYISMIRQLQVCLCTTNEYFNAVLRRDVAVAMELCIKVHTNLRLRVKKTEIQQYQDTINELLDRSVQICSPSTPSACASIKFHWPRHWSDTRRDLGCSALEKSLERKLGETHKNFFRFTNANGEKEVNRRILLRELNLLLPLPQYKG